MYKYKNIRTGSIIHTHGKLTGGDWELMGTAKPADDKGKEEQADASVETTAETSAEKPAATKPTAKTTTKKAASTSTKPEAKEKAK